jgi:hypothetical protein
MKFLERLLVVSVKITLYEHSLDVHAFEKPSSIVQNMQIIKRTRELFTDPHAAYNGSFNLEVWGLVL